MALQHVDVRHLTTATADDVFDLLVDAPSWPVWSTHTSAVVDEPGATPGGVGQVHTFTKGRVRSRERVVVSDRPSHFAYELVSGLPLVGYRADVTLTPQPDGRTEIRWRSSFRARTPGTGPLYRFALTRFLRQVLPRLAAQAEARHAAADPATTTTAAAAATTTTTTG